eukprot:c11259_g2_i1 orf=3-455(-)
MLTTVPQRQGFRSTRRRTSPAFPLSIVPPSCKTGFHNEYQGDRFIPNRSAMDIDIARFNLLYEAKENASALLNITSPIKEEYRKKLAENLLQDRNVPGEKKVLAFKKKMGSALEEDEIFTHLFYCDKSPRRKSHRQIPQSPERILDAPELV